MLCTNISPNEWKKEIEDAAQKCKIKIIVRLINSANNFDLYTAILNPYGGVYPEQELKTLSSMDKILNYVKDKGLFVNISDILGYWAYDPLLKRRLDTTPTVYGVDKRDGQLLFIPARFFERTPFMEKLGLRVSPVNNELWDVTFAGEFSSLATNMSQVKVFRATAVEKNVVHIMEPKRENLTPLFKVMYGEGDFLLSQLSLDEGANSAVKGVLANIIVKLIQEKKGI